MKKVFSAILMAFMISCSFAYAGTKAGNLEIGVNFAYDHFSGGDSDADNIIFGGQFSYFITDAVSLGLTSVVMWNSPDDDSDDMIEESDTTIVFVEFQPDYHLNISGTIVPYLGPHLGIMYGDSDGESETDFDYGGHIGIKAFVSENSFFDLQGRYTRYNFDDDDVNDFRFQIGIHVFF